MYGDIGTSTLYGLKQAVEAGGAPTPDLVMGTVSLIPWSLLPIVALKCGISASAARFDLVACPLQRTFINRIIVYYHLHWGFLSP